jgi:plasmid stabilization system protein ParE
MRTVRFSKTALDQFNTLLAQGIERFGVRVVAEKRDRVYATVEHILAAFPAIKRPHPNLGLCVYAIARTPFVISTTSSLGCTSSFTATPICATSIQGQPSGRLGFRLGAHW